MTVLTPDAQTVSNDRQGSHLAFKTAAALCTRRVPTVGPMLSVREVRAMLVGSDVETASHVVVCADGRFTGIVTIEAVLRAPADCLIRSLIDRGSPAVGPGVDQEVAAWQAVRHGESALAVVDENRRFIGVIPPSRLIAVLLEEHEEDLSRLGGFLKSASTARATSEESAPRRFWHRLPWLLLGLCGAVLAADLVGRFEAHLRVHVVLAFFMPGIVYLADAVGTQTETVIVRGLSLGVLLRRMAGREILAGLTIGLALGTVTMPVVWWHWQDSRLALSVGASVFAASSTSTVAAMALPWLFDTVGIDPAFGSGPLATVIQDLLSIWIYLSVTSLLM